LVIYTCEAGSLHRKEFNFVYPIQILNSVFEPASFFFSGTRDCLREFEREMRPDEPGARSLGMGVKPVFDTVGYAGIQTAVFATENIYAPRILTFHVRLSKKIYYI
jgi:hypothetical protein